MINILIADDDILTLNQLNMYLSTLENIQIVGQAHDGTEAISFLENSRIPVHLLILDMEMPKTTGLDVAGYIERQKLPVIILVLSNYDNFEYVKPILRLGAWDYLLKHELTPEILKEKINEISEHLDQKQITQKQNAFITALTGQQFLRKLALHQRIPENHLLCALSGKEFQGAQHLLLLMQITNYVTFYQNNYENHQQKIVDMVLSLSTTVLSSLGEGFITHINTGEFLIYLNLNTEISSASMQQKSQHYIAALKNNLSRYLNINTIFESVIMYDTIHNVRPYYLKLHHALLHKPFDAQTPSDFNQEYLITLYQEKELLDAVIHFNTKAIQTIFHEIFEPLKSKSVSLYQIRGLVSRLFEIINHLLQGFPNLVDIEKNQKQIPNLLDINALETFFINHYENCISHISKTSIHKYPPLIQTALLYIHQNYNQDISLLSTADYCNITDVYLSKIFKQTLNVSFSKYLSNYRIQMAEHFLTQTDLSLKEISNRCGFQNYNYFLTVFKNTVGVTPVQYKNRQTPDSEI